MKKVEDSITARRIIRKAWKAGKCHEVALKNAGFEIDNICISNICEPCKDYYLAKCNNKHPEKPQGTLSVYLEARKDA